MQPCGIHVYREVPVLSHSSEPLLVLLLALLIVSLLAELSQFHTDLVSPAVSRRGARPLRPRPPDDGAQCRAAAAAPPPASPTRVIPYGQLKSPRGRKKTIDTRGYACPYSDCRYLNITDPAVHALVGYGHHGHPDPIQDFYCQAGRRKFSARRHTPLYGLKIPRARVAQVLHAVAEGLSPHAAARVFDLSETTVRSWITRAGQHSRSLHDPPKAPALTASGACATRRTAFEGSRRDRSRLALGRL